MNPTADLPDWAAPAQARAECQMAHVTTDGAVRAVALAERLYIDGTAGNLQFVCADHLRATQRRRGRIAARVAHFRSLANR